MVQQSKDPQLNQQIQRIYIGGIDPSRGLTVVEVWQRLEAKLANPGSGIPKLQWSELYCGNRCLQLTVIQNSEDLSPLTLLKSWFHNVMWKGCKLVVDEARPHFLQRLQEERNSRQQNESLCTVAIEENHQQSESHLKVLMQQPSRYWKVRRGYYGEPVRHVDTQSCDVTSWSMFERIRQRHKKQQEKERLRRIELLKSGTNMTVKEAQKRAYYNRSIRLRFTDEMDITEGSCATDHQLLHDDVTSSDQSVENTDDDDDDDNDDDDDTNESDTQSNAIKDKTAKYMWSDDESDEAESPLSGSNADTAEKNLLSTSHLRLNTGANRSNYIWSDDETSTDSGISREVKEFRTNKLRDLDEFESALVLDNIKNVTAKKEPTSIDDSTNVHDDDISLDVARNLSILSQLFPETSKVPSIPHRTEVNEQMSTTAPTLTPAPLPKSSGWAAPGQMLRFDPSLPQSASLILNDDTASTKSDTANGIDHAIADNDSSDNSVHDEHEQIVQKEAEEVTEEATASAGVYEQKKLEQVFKEAREGVAAASSAGMDFGTAFAFRFEVDDKDIHNNSEAASSNFSFDFVINETKDSKETIDDVNLAEVSNEAIMPENVTDNGGAGNRPRFSAFDFPNEDMLNEMVHTFYYKINDGERIIRDVDGWRNDPTVKDKWLKERLALTQDWKRKRKFALAKKEKRGRHG